MGIRDVVQSLSLLDTTPQLLTYSSVLLRLRFNADLPAGHRERQLQWLITVFLHRDLVVAGLKLQGRRVPPMNTPRSRYRRRRACTTPLSKNRASRGLRASSLPREARGGDPER